MIITVLHMVFGVCIGSVAYTCIRMQITSMQR